MRLELTLGCYRKETVWAEVDDSKRIEFGTKKETVDLRTGSDI